MRVRKQSNPSIPVKKPLSKLIRKASTASQKRKESIKETTNVSQPQTPRKRRNSLRPTKFRSNWTPADQGTYQPVILALDAPPVQKLCYEAIRHNRENVVIHVRDCVKVCSSEGLENVGKIMRLYYDKLEKTLMASILWYYTPAQLDPRCTKSLDDCALRSFQVQEKELLASRHVDNVAVDAIESVAYVLTFNQYCRYKAEVRWKEQFGMPVELMPNAPRETFGYRRTYRLPDETTDPDVVYFCRAVYNLSHKRIRVMPKPQLPLKTKPPSRRGSSNTKTSVAKTTLVV
ncbi:bromo adjacent (BAH) domain-containing protein [Aphelenchoides avenae]|nr:bromo adjacent (BAH) domain-containing protein [Aphelenchus avenae]